ncbi:TauD/TfdA family dioxygenase [Actinomadura sp. NPDC048394]|uniref:TauD/TfdA family dioxygenase n=1 Tax=Actinomadura sp. NPDC048394 TaxID=3158223 RepID=UPI0033D29C6D
MGTARPEAAGTAGPEVMGAAGPEHVRLRGRASRADAAALLRRDGAVVLEDVPPANADLLDAVSFAGTPVAAGNGTPGRLVWDVRPDPAASPDVVSRGREAFDPHTDSTHYERPHPVIALAMVAPGEGGRSLLAPVARVLALLRARGRHEQVRLLGDACFPFAGDGPDGHPIVRRPILTFDDEGGARVRYHGRVLDWCVRQPSGRLDEEHAAALGAFRAALRAPGVVSDLALREGDVLVIDNHRVLHGRTEITGAGRRHVKRLKLDPR